MTHRLAPHWPTALGPMPTDEQFDAAERKYLKRCQDLDAKGDWSDFSMGNFAFVMGTYAAWTWCEFFGIDPKPLLPPLPFSRSA